MKTHIATEQLSCQEALLLRKKKTTGFTNIITNLVQLNLSISKNVLHCYTFQSIMYNLEAHSIATDFHLVRESTESI